MAEFDQFSRGYEERLNTLSLRAIGGGDSRAFIQAKCDFLLEILRERGVDPSRAVALDAGCGTGIAEQYFAGTFKELIALDCSEGMIQEAQKQPVARTQFLCADARRIPRVDASVDVVFSFCIFHHAHGHEHEELLSEFRRVLVPGGIVVVIEHNPWNPLTRYVVHRCPVDADATLISSLYIRKRIQNLGFTSIQSCYLVFFPRWMPGLRILERWLSWCPLGGQYGVIGQVPKGS